MFHFPGVQVVAFVPVAGPGRGHPGDVAGQVTDVGQEREQRRGVGVHGGARTALGRQRYALLGAGTGPARQAPEGTPPGAQQPHPPASKLRTSAAASGERVQQVH